MNQTTAENIKTVLIKHIAPYIYGDPQSINVIQEIDVRDNAVLVKLQFGYPVDDIKTALSETIFEDLKNVVGTNDITVNIDWDVIRSVPKIEKLGTLNNVKNILAIASCKGGVGKSTTSVNLALALAHAGSKVGILDADIYGPNQPKMLGVSDDTEPEIRDEKYFIPIEKHGIESMSIGYLLANSSSLAWRGPMISKALTQMLTQTLWSDLDYLIVDLPPGTGDTQLSLAQDFPISGAAIVTTPQEIALLDAQRGIEMFNKVNIPTLGIIENMSMHICTNCGHQDDIFGSGGGAKLAEQCNAPLLGSLPLLKKIRQQADNGVPLLADNPDCDASLIYQSVARNMVAQLWSLQVSAAASELNLDANLKIV